MKQYYLITNFNGARVEDTPYLMIDTINATCSYWRRLPSDGIIKDFYYSKDKNSPKNLFHTPELWIQNLLTRCPEWKHTLKLVGYSDTPNIITEFPELLI